MHDEKTKGSVEQALGAAAQGAAQAVQELGEALEQTRMVKNPYGILPFAHLPFAPDLSPLSPYKRTKSRKPRKRKAQGIVAKHAKTRRKIAGQSRRKNRKG